MEYENLRNELYSFYLHGDADRSRAFAEKCFAIMDSRATDEITVTEQKLLQYDVITEEFEPIIFPHCPYFWETGFLTSLSDGARKAKGHGFFQANGWVYGRNQHLFIDQDPALYEKRQAHMKEKLYLICGPYNDVSQHFNFNNRPILKDGLKGIYERAKAELSSAKNSDEREFLGAVCRGMLSLKRMAEKFAEKSEAMLKNETDPEKIKNLSLISETARRVPWEAPKTLYEALAALAFMRTALGSLEGIGPNTFGRIDKDLIGFYLSDVQNGILTPESAYDLICKFLIIWDCHYDHNMIMEGYADHELENTYTLGGCDDDGKPLFNEITKMFLRATREERIIFPKIKCRFSYESPKEYLDEIDLSVANGTSTVLFQNDEASIASLLRAGRPLDEARDYYISGCWGMATNQEKCDHGSYLNLLKSFEFALHDLSDKMKDVDIYFESLGGCESFEELYGRVLRNCRRLIRARIDVTRRGGRIFHKVDRFPIFSSTLENCLEKHADFTMGGAKYADDFLLMFGLPNIVDSLLAIKELVFDSGRYTYDELLGSVRRNWENAEDMRLEATRCHGWGDGSEESSSLAARFNDDLFRICGEIEGTYGGKVNMGHLTYTEIRWWGEATLATPHGRKSGDYFAQGLTPSRLKRIPNVTDVINSLSRLDGSTMAANSVVNIILPGNLPLDVCESFLRAASKSALQSLQLNCVSRDTLLDAQKHPEKYPDLVVRVTGFSAKFTALSEGWQNEVLSRNFYR